MESKDNQGDKMFESTANGEWGNPNQPVCDPELHEIIRRIYELNFMQLAAAATEQPSGSQTWTTKT